MVKFDDAIIIDGLVISKFSRELFEDMARGGITAANCTCSIWHNFSETMANILQWNEWFREHDDLITKVCSTEDIRTAKSSGRVGIILGWQNTSAIDTDIGNLQIFHELGIRVMQLTYNTQNLVGSGCWESHDGGLSDFGRQAIDEMNRLGILIDLSHVGAQTTAQTIEHSSAPVAYTHCGPMLKQHARNKTDAQLRAIAERGGFIGFASYTPFLPKGVDSTLVGEDLVGIGTDWVQDQDIDFFDYLCRDKGVGRPTTPRYSSVPPMPKGLETLGEFRNFIPAMERARWSEARIRRVLGENWLGFLQQVW
jgi:membrane dipeptidase